MRTTRVGIYLWLLAFLMGAVVGCAWSLSRDPFALPASGPAVVHRALAPAAARDLPFADLIPLPVDRLLKVIDGLPGGDALTPLQRAGLATVMATRGVEPVIRNNIANRLTGMTHPDPDLWRRFLAMYQDPAEDEVWRDYSVQFLALSLPAADDRDAALAALTAIAEQDRGTIGTTALLHLVRLANDGTVLRPATLAALAVARLQDPATPDPSRHVALALIGQEGWREHLPLVRAALDQHPGPDAARGALYTLGVLGDGSDAAVIRAWTAATHPAVAQAAEVAVQRLAARTGAGGVQP